MLKRKWMKFMVVMVAVAAVCAAFGLEGDLYLHEIRSETAEHILDHMVRTDTKGVVSIAETR